MFVVKYSNGEKKEYKTVAEAFKEGRAVEQQNPHRVAYPACFLRDEDTGVHYGPILRP